MVGLARRPVRPSWILRPPRFAEAAASFRRTPVVTTTPSKSHDSQALDALTGGAFSAPTSGERAARIRDWLAGNPDAELIQQVFQELSVRDRGAAKPLREKLDEIKRARGQEALASEWAAKAQALLELPRLNIADAMAWQRDAAKAGAPLSKEPLSSFRTQLSERVRGIEDLQHRVQVQREAAVLLAQRIEVLSTKPWQDAQAALEALRTDVAAWQQQADTLAQDTSWASVDGKFPPLLDASKAQLLVVWDAFQASLEQARLASEDADAPLPPVRVWADALRLARGEVPEPVAAPAAAPKPARPAVDPAQREQAEARVSEALAKLQQEVAEGHGKASSAAATALRAVLKDHGRHVGDKLEAEVHTALVSAGELEGWQRWRADQLREELVIKAEGLLKRPEGHALGGRKMQDTLRQMREQWKQTDQGGPANHALWKRFDEACNAAHKVVEEWLDKRKTEAAEHKAQRLALLEELKAWAAEHAASTDWKLLGRSLHQFENRWREAGHLGEKAFADLQNQWKEAIQAAAAPLEQAQQASIDRRRALIEEAKVLGAAPMLRIDAVKALQQRWQSEAQTIPLERKFEQKLWDAFRKPIDEAFQRKTEEREKAAGAMSQVDRAVLDAARAVEAANASGDAQKIRSALAALEAATRGQAAAAAAVAVPAAPVAAPAAAEAPADAAATPADAPADAAPEGEATAEEPAPAPAPAPVRKPVVAMRGDDRPGMQKAQPAPARGGARFGDRDRGSARPGDNRFEPRRDGRDGGRFGDRPPMADRGPRLGDAAFRAQREATEHAQAALRKLAAQAHGEVLTNLLGAWEKRAAEQVPSAQELGGGVNSAVRGQWVQSIAAPAGDDKAAAEALLRLEIAAEAPTPAEQISARRMLQLQLLTRRNDPSPAQTWAQDTAKVLASPYDAGTARRVQNVLKVLLKR
jgi:ATP-dependent RNA helicase SUPV3L1/SUV3